MKFNLVTLFFFDSIVKYFLAFYLSGAGYGNNGSMDYRPERKLNESRGPRKKRKPQQELRPKLKRRLV